MTFLVQQTLIYAIPLMIVALAGVFAERSGIINLALEGIMIFGAFVGVYFVRYMQEAGTFAAAKEAGDWVTLQGFELLAMLVAALMGALFSLLLSFASVNLKADQTIGGTALNLMAPALVLFLIRIRACPSRDCIRARSAAGLRPSCCAILFIRSSMASSFWPERFSVPYQYMREK